MNSKTKIRKIIKKIIQEELMSSPKYYVYAAPTTNFPYEKDEQDNSETQNEIIKIATSMGFEPIGYVADTNN